MNTPMFISLIFVISAVHLDSVVDEKSENVIVQLVDPNIPDSTKPSLQSKYVLMSSVAQINGFYNYIFVTDLYGPQMVLLQSKDQCKLSVDVDALKDNKVKGSVKFLKKGSSDPCSISRDDYVLMKIGGLLELNENNKDTVKSYDFDQGYSRLKISNHSTIYNTNVFNFTFSNQDSNITIDVGYYGKRSTMAKLPNNPVGPLVALIEMQVKNLSVKVTSSLALHMSFVSSQKNNKFGSFLNRFFSDLQSPGIFRTYNISLYPSNNTQNEKITSWLKNFALFWKAVAYTDKPPRRSSQIMADVNSKYKCDKTKPNFNLAESTLIDMIELSPIQTYDCFRVDFVALNKDSLFSSTKYMDWSCTFGFTNYYENIMPVGIVSVVAVAYAAPLFVGVVLFLLSKTTHRIQSPSTYAVISIENDEENDDDEIDNESLYIEENSAC